ncbi:deoxyribodipyrimidine photo-lyase [Rhodobacter sp. NTK016B]|uniref:cryptochrome/photolyase family protein n=1 Tax=Rhodobacter sp. NTK016B TaxID=2759676 RepID=UPI001A8C09FB|nr:deoxyribodipyrimidine photo-lyase [Rhodobacter sp. NTK016B]MBN8293845.1 deoxyribodipyrimidine photo-lyase [Rhodobacter sp. NTK016B]
MTQNDRADTPLILWFRRDLRLDDHPMLTEAAATGRPLIPVFIADRAVTGIGAAARWRYGEAIGSFAARLKDHGSRLILRKGAPLPILLDLLQEAGAGGVWWTRLYDPLSRDRDSEIKEVLKGKGFNARSFSGHTLIEPWEIATKAGDPYKVYTPFFRALDDMGVAKPCDAPDTLHTPDHWPDSEGLDDWALGAAMNRGAAIVAKHAVVGEAAALARMETFLDGPVLDYKDDRDFPAKPAVSGLSENLTYGEIGARRVWHAAKVHTGQGGTHFRKELAWRDFAHHLMFHFPHLLESNWREEWDDFPWREDNKDAERWRRGMTGEPFVDAGLREMYVTGTMHNRVRMVVASYLTKHLTTHWKVGMDWFADCLIDWDPASNAMGWQWVAGSGPDAAPYFRVFNPETQAEKFDKSGDYRKAFIAELSKDPGEEAQDYFNAVPRAWQLDPKADYPDRVIALSEGREAALEAYDRLKKS